MRRLFIIRKDLHLSPGKLAAMCSHCAEAYWTNMLRKCTEQKPVSVENGKVNMLVDVDEKIWAEYALGIFTKTICEADNLNQLKKAELKAMELGLIQGIDWGYINDCCLTELKPENPDGTTTIGIWFKPLSDEITHTISKKFKLYGAFDKKRNCDVYRDYDSARNAFIEDYSVTNTNSDMMKWLLEPYVKPVKETV